MMIIQLYKKLMKKKQKHKLLVKKAWDFIHLAYVWDIPLLSNHPKLWSEHNDTFGTTHDLDEYDVTFIQMFLEKVLKDHYENCMNVDGCVKTCRLKEVATDLRTFLRNLGKTDCSYWSPVWIGMSKVSKEKGGDETLIRASIPLIASMWD